MTALWLAVSTWLSARLPDRDHDRGDVPGWVLITVMTAAIVMGLWFVAGAKFTDLFNNAFNNVSPKGQ